MSETAPYAMASDVDRLLQYEGRAFIECCYVAILGRPPEEAGLNLQLAALAGGDDKLQLAGRISLSEEAKNRPVRLRGLSEAVIEQSLKLLATSPPGAIDVAAQAAIINEHFDLMRKVSAGDGGASQPIQAVPHSPAPASPPASMVQVVPMQSSHLRSAGGREVTSGIATLWLDLTTSVEWDKGIVGIIRVELELARALGKIDDRVRFSVQIGTGFVEIERDQLAWLLQSDNVCDAYMNFTGRGSGHVGLPGQLRLSVPDTQLFFHPFSTNDLVLSVGWMESRKEIYFSKLKATNPNVYLCYLIYDGVLILPITSGLYYTYGRDQFKGYVEWASRQCDFLLYGGETAKSDIESIQRQHDWPSPPGAAIYFGSNFDSLNHEADEAAYLQSIGITGPFILAVGTIEPRKNYETLYRAYLMCLRSAPEVTPQLVICGRPHGHVNEMLSILTRDPRIKGRILIVAASDRELLTLYRRCRFTVLASLYEGWSLTLPESLTVGRLCIASDVPPLREIGGDLIVYVPPLDVKGWAEEVLRYASDDVLLQSREDEIQKRWFKPKWSEFGQVTYNAVHALAKQTPPSAALQRSLGKQVAWTKPTIWMDLSLTFLNYQGSIQGIPRAELTFAYYLKKLEPGARFFAYQNKQFFEILPGYLDWLWDASDLSMSFKAFQQFWQKAEAAGEGNRNPLAGNEFSEHHPAFLHQIPDNSIALFCGIGFAQPGQVTGERAIIDLVSTERRVMTSQLLYDFTPFLVPQYHDPRTVEGYVPFFDIASNHFDHLLYGGRTAQRDGIRIQKERGWKTPPSDFLEFGSNLDLSTKELAPISAELRRSVLIELGITEAFVMTVGTIQPRKNHDLLYKAYLTILENNLAHTPIQMVFVGHKGWLSDSLVDMIKNDERVKGKLLLLSPTDDQLRVLYECCEFTLLPSFYEGWSLTLPESLGYGKFCLVADTEPLRETGAELVEYIDPLDTYQWARRIAFYVNEPGELKRREQMIVEQWKARSWNDSTQLMIEKLYQAHREMTGGTSH